MKKRTLKRRDALKVAAAAVTVASTRATAAAPAVPSFMLETLGQLSVNLVFKDRDGKETTQTFPLGELSRLAGHVGEYTVEVLNVREKNKTVLARGAFRHIYSLQ
ncbi:MAG: hypothetical protein JNM17_34420 [Archangium sp.]|nr:hypothetical protein [Archangium sp.]